jgi:tetratricopeptide (TPR) repeat protein
VADRNRDQIELVTEELEDLDAQVAAGDLDDQTADSLRAKYVAELDRLMEARGQRVEPEAARGLAAPPALQARRPPPDSGRASWISGRTVVGTAIVAVAITAIAVMAVGSLTDNSTAGTEGIASDVIEGDGPIDLSLISNEEMESIVDQNPDVVGMRLALARRYFEQGDFDGALDHYMVILEAEQHPEALANVGWMTYISGRPEIALGYVEAALERQPDAITAIWFLGNIQFTLGNREAAIEALSIVVATNGIPDDVKQSAEDLLVDLESE